MRTPLYTVAFLILSSLIGLAHSDDSQVGQESSGNNMDWIYQLNSEAAKSARDQNAPGSQDFDKTYKQFQEEEALRQQKKAAIIDEVTHEQQQHIADYQRNRPKGDISPGAMLDLQFQNTKTYLKANQQSLEANAHTQAQASAQTKFSQQQTKLKRQKVVLQKQVRNLQAYFRDMLYIKSDDRSFIQSKLNKMEAQINQLGQ